ncbi:MAG: PilZ domain-containing protein [Magnetococcales bacterium]|nr:PilZ domain-containing protein [Magnetococcales bacterium]
MDISEQEQDQEKEKPELRPLAVYGQTVVDLFSVDIDTATPVCLLPIYNRDQVLCRESYQEFFLHAHEKWSEALRAVSLLQENLTEEKRQAAAVGLARSHEVKTPILDRFRAFQEAIEKGDEESIEDNPFFKLTRMLFYLNMQAAQGAMQDAVASALAEHERANMQVVVPIRDIWRPTGKKQKTFRAIGRNISATLRTVIIGLKPFISVLLFLLSSVTTFRGVNELLQLPLAQKLFGTLFLGNTGESARYVAGLVVGISLSLAILDFKGRLFQGFAEKGRFWQGLLHTLGVNPRWIVLATLLTFFSIYTNYDGIVSLVSKQGELQKQWVEIKNRVELVLGDTRTANPDHPQTLHGLKKALDLTVQQAISTFEKLPEDELSGIASSQDPRKGPRYWAKHFVVFGGYAEGLVDLPRVYANTDTSRNINAILLGSKLNFSKGIEEKIRELTGRYQKSFVATNDSILDDLDKLDQIMRPNERSVAEMRRFMTLEYYDINTLVQHITASFEENKRIYDEVANELNALIKSHVAVLRQVDKYGNTPQVHYTISATVDVPAIEGISALKKGVIPVAAHKDIAALNRFLADEYGATMASFILMAILAFSISLDLGELLLFIGFTLRTSRKDEKILERKLASIAVWNDAFIDKVRGFFEKKEVWFSLLSWLPRPSEILMRDAQFMWLYKMDGELACSGGRAGPFTRWKVWLVRLFSAAVRREACYGLEAWDRALDRAQRSVDRGKCSFLGVLYPGLRWDNKLRKLSFAQLGSQISLGMKRGQTQFEESLKKSCGVHLCKKLTLKSHAREESKSKSQRDFEMTLNMAYSELDPQARRQRQESGHMPPSSGGSLSGNKGVCSNCGSSGFLQAWRCVEVKISEGCPISHQDEGWLLSLQKSLIHFLIYAVYCPLWWVHYWLFSVSFINDKNVFPWSRKKWLYDFCISNRGRIERKKIILHEKKGNVDFEYILSKISPLRTDKIKRVMTKLDEFDGGWAKAWKLSINHYANILRDIEEEARMIRGLGKDANDVADEMQLYNKEIGLGNLLYYESPHNFSLLEQFKTIEFQIEDALERIDDIGILDRKKSQFSREIEETCADVNRLLVKIKVGLVSGDVDYQSWKLVGGDKVYQQITEEAEKIVATAQEYNQQDIVDQGEDTVIKLNQLRVRSQQLRDQLMDAKVALSHPVVRSNTPAVAKGQEIQEPAPAQTWSEQTRAREISFPASPTETLFPTEEVHDLFPEKESIRKSAKGDWAVAVRSKGSTFKEKPVATPITQNEQAGYIVARSQPREKSGAIAREGQTGYSPFRNHTEDVGSRRETERSLLKIESEFATAHGVVHRGTTEDVSITGVRMRLRPTATDAPPPVREGMSGTFRFLHLPDETGFPCRVVRIVGNDMTLTIHEDTSRYGLLVMQEILAHHKIELSSSGPSTLLRS